MDIKIQRQLSNGSWLDEDRVDQFLDRAARKNELTRDEVIDVMKSNPKSGVYYDCDWYASIRIKLEPRPIQHEEFPLVQCGCGHSIEKSLIMHTSTGTSCPNCYDRMSE